MNKANKLEAARLRLEDSFPGDTFVRFDNEGLMVRLDGSFDMVQLKKIRDMMVASSPGYTEDDMKYPEG